MALTLDDLFRSPDHYLHSFEGDAAVFVPMDRAAYARSIFLDARISAAGSGAMRVPVAALERAAPSPPVGWIFHLAHGGSTLLARALDAADANLVLREPLALRQVALAPDPARLRLVRTMLGKRYAPALPTIVKANVPVNFILPELAAADGQAPALFLWSGLSDYLLAILRGPDHRRWVRGVTGQLAAHLGDLAALSDAQCAAALWHAQMRAFARAMTAFPQSVSLDSETLFNAPRRALTGAAAALGVPIDDDTAAAITAGPLFASHSKRPGVAFDNEARLARRTALAATMRDELAEAEAWVERAGGAAPLPRPLA